MIRRLTILAVSALVVLGLTSGTAVAAPARSLCTYDTLRGAVPDNFGIEACVDGQSVWLRNNLSVPITVRASGDSRQRVKVDLDQTPAAIVTRLVQTDPDIVMPNDLVRIPLGDGAAEVSLVDTAAGGTYVLASTLSSFLPSGPVIGAYDAFAQLIVDWDNAARTRLECRTGKNVLQQTACDLRAVGSLTFSLGKAIAMGAAQGLAALVLNTADWGVNISKQVPDVGTIVNGARTLSQAIRPAPTTTPAPSTSSPPPTQPPPPTSVPPVVESPQTVPQPPPQTSAPQPPATSRGFVIEDDFYGGTWARNDPDDNFWHGRNDPPSNAAYWYPNGLGVAVECATPAAGYLVRFNDGRPDTTWWWWARVTDGKYVPVATLRGTFENGPQGLTTC